MKSTTLAILAAGIFIGGAILFSHGGSSASPQVAANTVSVVDGKQIIEIHAKGGYQCRESGHSYCVAI
jgi:glutaredoxin